MWKFPLEFNFSRPGNTYGKGTKHKRESVEVVHRKLHIAGDRYRTGVVYHSKFRLKLSD